MNAPLPDNDDIIRNLDLRDFYEQYLGELSKTNRNGWLLRRVCCPNHADRNPSFSVNLLNGRFKCFSQCGGGDIFDFLQKMTGADFPTAKRQLAAMAGFNLDAPMTAAERADWAARVEKRHWERDATERFRKWQVRYSSLCGATILYIHRRFREGFFSMAAAEAESYLFHVLPVAEYHLEILCSGDDVLKASLYQEVTKNGKCGFE